MENNKWNEARSLMERMEKVEGKNLNFVEFGSNKRPLVPLNESDIAKLLDRHETEGYIIVSACRDTTHLLHVAEVKKEYDVVTELRKAVESGDETKVNELGNAEITLKNITNKVNNERSKELRSLVNDAGFTYKQIYGGFHEKDTDDFQYEQSLMIFPRGKNEEIYTFEELDAFALEMCRKYDQDSYLRVTPGGVGEYVNKEGEVTDIFQNGKTYNDYTKMFFSDLHKNSDKYKDGDINSPARPTRFTLKEVYVNPRPSSYQEGHIRWHKGECADWPIGSW